MNRNYEWIGLNELKLAIKRNPQKVIDETKKYLTRGIAEYKRGIINNPWKINKSGGGSPVRTGNLRDLHLTQIGTMEAFIGPNVRATPYAVFVHQGTRKMQGRPWLEYVKVDKMTNIEKLYREFLKNIVNDLAS